MSIDYAKKEQAFLDSLEPDTGHGLDAWLALIDAEHLKERNDIIDWLRQHGFTFSRASWIERIHHNGGQPIYAGATSSARRSRMAVDRPTSSGKTIDEVEDTPDPPAPLHQTVLKRDVYDQKQTVADSASPTSPPQPKTNDKQADGIEPILVRAKGLRPLAQHIIREIQAAVSETVVTPGNALLQFNIRGMTFAVVAVSSKDLRLGLVLTGEAPQPPFQAPKFTANQARNWEKITHMLVLDDVRQFDEPVLAQVKRAAEVQ